MAFYRRLQTAEEKSNLQERCHAVLKEWLDCWNVSRAFSGVLGANRFLARWSHPNFRVVASLDRKRLGTDFWVEQRS